MLQVGDEVLLMSAPGRFVIVAIDGDVLTIEGESGIRKQVAVQAVRKRPAKAS